MNNIENADGELVAALEYLEMAKKKMHKARFWAKGQLSMAKLHGIQLAADEIRAMAHNEQAKVK